METPPADDPLIGREIDGYLLKSCIGSGATGVVYRAERGQEQVAFKVLNQAVGHIETLRRRFQREARALAKLEHANIVRIVDYGVDDEVVYIAMELLDGISLEESLLEGPLDPAMAIEVMKQVLAGVAYAHDQQIVHRDLKPANVFLRAGDIADVAVLDFGLAKFLSVDELSQEGTLTRRGRVVGTPAYMAPEQITGAVLDVRADVYSAGTMLFELLADRRPFDYIRRSRLLRAHLFEPVPDMSSVRPGLVVSEELEEVVRRALAKDYSERWADAGAMRSALEQVELPSFEGDAEQPRVRRSASETHSVVLTNEERMQVVHGADADPTEDAEGTPNVEATIGAESRWGTLSVWVVGVLGLCGLVGLAVYATTIR